MKRQRNTGAHLLAAERRAQAIDLRKSGATFAEIGAALGITKQSAHALVARMLAESAEQVRAECDELRALELARLDALQVPVWPRAMDGDLPAVDCVLRIMARRARLLGLDAPTRMTHGGDPDTPPIVAAAALLDWRALLGPHPIVADQVRDES